MSKRLPRDPLLPLDAAVSITFYWALAVVGLLVVVIIVPPGSDGGASVFSFGDTDACVEVDHEVAAGGADAVGNLRDGARSWAVGHDVCLTDPSGVQRLTASAGPMANAALLLAFVVMSRRLIRRARREPFFAGGVADGFQRIGWLLVLGCIAAGVIDSITTGLIVVDATRGNSVASQLFFPDVNLLVFLGGCIFISFARILRWAGALQAEVDTLV